jgi:hypothetical protein
MSPIPSYPDFCQKNRPFIQQLNEDYPAEIAPIALDALYRSIQRNEPMTPIIYTAEDGSKRQVMITAKFTEDWEIEALIEDVSSH